MAGGRAKLGCMSRRSTAQRSSAYSSNGSHPRAGAPTHHHAVEEVLTVIAGEAEMWIGEEHVVVSSGQSLIVPAGHRHGFRNVGHATLHLQAVLASPVLEATFDGSPEPVRRWLKPG